LTNKHQGIIHKISIIYSKTADDKKDLFQDIVCQLWRSYPKYRGDAQFSTWMYRVALNTALMNIRHPSVDLADQEKMDQYTENKAAGWDFSGSIRSCSTDCNFDNIELILIHYSKSGNAGSSSCIFSILAFLSFLFN